MLMKKCANKLQTEVGAVALPFEIFLEYMDIDFYNAKYFKV